MMIWYKIISINLNNALLVYNIARTCLTKVVVDVTTLRSDGKLFQTCIPLNVKDFLYMSVFALGKNSLHSPLVLRLTGWILS